MAECNGDDLAANADTDTISKGWPSGATVSCRDDASGSGSGRWSNTSGGESGLLLPVDGAAGRGNAAGGGDERISRVACDIGQGKGVHAQVH